MKKTNRIIFNCKHIFDGCADILASDRIDWLNAHYFDYRSLIPKGLAIEVTKENNQYEEINL